MLRIVTLLAVLAPVLVGSAIAEPIQWTVEEGGNGHWYDLVQLDSRDYDWCYLQALADVQIYLDVPGYLVTITSQEEQEFIFTQYGCDLSNYIAMGFYQSIVNSESAWIWITGELWAYENWYIDEPNNMYGSEYVGMFLAHGCDGGWNDYLMNSLSGYVVEYGEYNPELYCPTGEPILSEKSSWGEIKKAYR